MTKYRKITDISVVTDTTSIYQKNRYLKCRYVPIPIYRYRRYIDDIFDTSTDLYRWPWSRGCCRWLRTACEQRWAYPRDTVPVKLMSYWCVIMPRTLQYWHWSFRIPVRTCAVTVLIVSAESTVNVNPLECEAIIVPHQTIWSWYTAVDGWAVTFGTARRGLGGLRPV